MLFLQLVAAPGDQSTTDPDTAAFDLKGFCEKSVTAEFEDVHLNDKDLIPAVSAYSAIATVFLNLCNASADQHLPAFQCRIHEDGRLGRGPKRNRS